MAKKYIISGCDEVSVSDGYHTFDELYEHRITLYLALCQALVNIDWNHPKVWRSQLHSDGSNFDGWFVLGIGEKKGQQITYHLPNEKWDLASFADTLEKAPEYDGHSSDDVLVRLGQLFGEGFRKGVAE